MTVDFIYNIGRDSVDTSGFSAYVPLLSERMSYMMKKAPFFMAALAALTLTGAFLASPSAEAADKAAPQQEQQAQASKKQLKPWEVKYYELHPDAKKQDEEKANPSKHHSSDDDENWHRL